MARPATGREFVETAKARIVSAKTVDALRAAQALLLPLEFGLSLEQTAIVIGLSKVGRENSGPGFSASNAA